MIMKTIPTPSMRSKMAVMTMTTMSKICIQTTPTRPIPLPKNTRLNCTASATLQWIGTLLSITALTTFTLLPSLNLILAACMIPSRLLMASNLALVRGLRVKQDWHSFGSSLVALCIIGCPIHTVPQKLQSLQLPYRQAVLNPRTPSQCTL
jgi:hypothetical protein